jgi:hypothetical protein
MTDSDYDYEEGYICGEIRREDPQYDPRWDFADAAKAGTFAEFKRGFGDGFNGREPAP